MQLISIQPKLYSVSFPAMLSFSPQSRSYCRSRSHQKLRNPEPEQCTHVHCMHIYRRLWGFLGYKWTVSAIFTLTRFSASSFFPQLNLPGIKYFRFWWRLCQLCRKSRWTVSWSYLITNLSQQTFIWSWKDNLGKLLFVICIPLVLQNVNVKLRIHCQH